MIITKELLLKEAKDGLLAILAFTLGMFLIPLLMPLAVTDISITNLIISEIVVFLIFTFPFGCLIGLRSFIHKIKTINAIENDKFIIVEDIITGVYLGKSHAKGKDSIGSMSLKKYTKKRIQINGKEYNGFEAGEKCILVFSDITKDPIFVYSGNIYELDAFLKGKIFNVDRIAVPEKNYSTQCKSKNETILLTKKQLLKDCVNKSHKKTIIVTLIGFITAMILAIIVIRIKLIGTIICAVASLLFFAFSILKISYLSKIKKSIKNNKYILVKDVVVEKGYSKLYESNYLRFEKYKNNYYYKPDQLMFSDSVIGDVFYMLYIPGEYEPLEIYVGKRIIISDEINNNIK